MTDINRTKFTVLVDNNFDLIKNMEALFDSTGNYRRYNAGEFDTYEEALAECKEIVDDSLNQLKLRLVSQSEGPVTAEALFNSYQGFGYDPFISPESGTDKRFSAWKYAEERCQILCEPEL